MTNKFDQSIFGQLIHPESIPKKQKITSNNEKYQYNNNYIPLSFNKKNIQLLDNKVLSPKKRLQTQIITDNYNKNKYISKQEQKQFLSISTNIPNTYKSQIKKDFIINIKNLSNNDLFQCIKCTSTTDKAQCTLCKGKGKISGNDNIVKFIQYIIDFKIRLRQPYRLQNIQYIKLNQQSKCLSVSGSPNNPPTKPKTFMSLKQFKQQKAYNIRQRQRHTGYQCDKCKVNPIQGIRYHCAEPECKNDYDLCQLCLFEYGHEHQMQQITDNGFYKYFSTFINSIFDGFDDKKQKSKC